MSIFSYCHSGTQSPIPMKLLIPLLLLTTLFAHGNPTLDSFVEDPSAVTKVLDPNLLQNPLALVNSKEEEDGERNTPLSQFISGVKAWPMRMAKNPMVPLAILGSALDITDYYLGFNMAAGDDPLGGLGSAAWLLASSAEVVKSIGVGFYLIAGLGSIADTLDGFDHHGLTFDCVGNGFWVAACLAGTLTKLGHLPEENIAFSAPALLACGFGILSLIFEDATWAGIAATSIWTLGALLESGMGLHDVYKARVPQLRSILHKEPDEEQGDTSDQENPEKQPLLENPC